MKKYIDLFFTMLKIGLFTFGGGYAMIALLENEFVSRRKWIEKNEFLDMVAIAESTPGPIAINAATYIGYRVLRFRGSLIATVGVCIPSFAIIYVISLFFDKFLSLTFVANAFKGIQICVIYLIFSAGVKMLKGISKTPFNVITIIAVMSAMIITSILAVNFSTIYYILICGICGVVLHLFQSLSANKERSK